MKNLLMMVKTVTPLHVGTGRGSGDIDLEVARERVTGWPVIPGSSVKGVMRDAFYQQLHSSSESTQQSVEATLNAMFGASGENSHSGSLCCSDLRLVAFAVRSFYGCYAVITCPTALRRAAELFEITGTQHRLDTLAVQDNQILVQSNSALSRDKQVFLDEIDFQSVETDLKSVQTLFGIPCKLEQIGVVSDTVFGYFTRNATEVSTRVTLEPGRKTAKKGGLRTEEAVPPESIFCGLLHFQNVGKSNGNVQFEEFNSTRPDTLVFGGKTSTGHGVCRVAYVESQQ